eukprot:220657-Pyramimonas_sp.AAC.1
MAGQADLTNLLLRMAMQQMGSVAQAPQPPPPPHADIGQLALLLSAQQAAQNQPAPATAQS